MPVNQLTHGLSFHPEFALCRASPPYDDPSRLERLRQMLEGSRGLALRQAAEEADGAGLEEACRELRRKAAEHEGEALAALKDKARFEAMLEQVEATMDKVGSMFYRYILGLEIVHRPFTNANGVTVLRSLF